jgi:hypothetical protein
MNLLPDVSASASSLLLLFEEKGFTAAELAALIGAHSTSKNVAQTNIPVGEPQDLTPGIWDVSFYAQTLSQPAGMVSFASDLALSQDPTVGPEFDIFVTANSQGRWGTAFSAAFTHMSLLGFANGATPPSHFIDCSAVIPRSQNVNAGGGNAGGPGKRDIHNSGLFGRAAGGASYHNWH